MNAIALDNNIKPIDAGACVRTIKMDIHFEIHLRLVFKISVFKHYSAEHKGRYFGKFVTRLFWGTIDFHSRIFFLLWKSMVPQNCSVSHILQNIFLCVQQNKDIHTGLELLEGE